MEDGKLIEKPISPERGQLLYSLIQSDLGPESSRDILNSSDFSYTDLRKVNLGRGVHLKHARLDHADLTRAHMPAVNLERAELKEAQMSKINLSDAILKRARLHNANLQGAELLSTDLTHANLYQANLSNADLSEATLWGAKLDKADLTDAILDNVIVDKQNWIDHIKSIDVKGASDIDSKYRVKKQGKQQFKLISRK